MFHRSAPAFSCFFSMALVATSASAEGIGVRTVNGRAELYDTATGDRFLPRGNTHTMLCAPIAPPPPACNDAPPQGPGLDQVLFDPDPGRYDHQQAAAALAQMRHDGYNVVRVFLNLKRTALPPPAPPTPLPEPMLDDLYFANVVDFLALARSNHLYVILTTTFLPNAYRYYVCTNPTNPLPCTDPPTVTEGPSGYANYPFMAPGYSQGYAYYWRDILRKIKASDPTLLNTVLAYDVWTEPVLYSDFSPFSMSSGTVNLFTQRPNDPAPDMHAYDMGSPTSRQAAADDTARFWFNRVAAAIKAESPAALVDASVFSPYGVRRMSYDGLTPAPCGDTRAPFRPSVLQGSLVDIIDIHTYPTNDPRPPPCGIVYSMADDLNRAEIGLLGVTKPVIAGEYGAFRATFPDVTQAAYGLLDHQVGTCAYRFQGWLLWTWNSPNQTNLWNAVDAGGVVNGVLAPINRNDPCRSDQPTAFVTGQTLGPARNDYTGWAGMKITTGAASLSVYSLGRMAAPGNTGYHAVKLVYASTGADVSGGQATVDMTGAPTGYFRYANLRSPVTLAPNIAYYLVSQEASGGDQWYDYQTVVTTTSVAAVNGIVYSGWNFIALPNHSYVPVDFRYSISAVLDVTTAPGTIRNDYTGWVGMKITTGASAIRVISLGRMVAAGNTGTHTVKLVRASDGVDVVGGSAAVPTAGGTAGQFQYASLPGPVTLQANTAYYVVSQETFGGDIWRDWDTQITPTSVATIDGPVYGNSGTNWNLVPAPGQGYGPVDLRYLSP